jgi:hypothetical protein
MKASGVLLALMLSAPSAFACAERAQVTPGAQAHISRVEVAMSRLRQAPTSREANADANRAMQLLLTDQTAEGDEALAALAGHYLGESTEPECEILRRGVRMVTLLDQFSTNPPTVQLRPSEAHSRAELIAQIRSGKVCE